jgi:glycosyltransferase involved in cell wall biosynthesis
MVADRISVCVCTFRRAALLERLLAVLAVQLTNGTFSYDVVVVDNDRDHSSEEVVRRAARESAIPISYDCETERNISLTRNRAIRNAGGNLIAFIDDDELPAEDWLLHLHRTMKAHTADGVLAPVLPEFPAEAPDWLRKGRLFDRRRHPTGTRITAEDARTGNVLLDRSLFAAGHGWFDPAFGRTGGEDSDFFARQFERGSVFVWCDEAVVYETVPPERWKESFHVKRLWRAGTIDGEWIRAGRLSPSLFAKNLLLLGICALATPPAFVLPKHLRMRVAQKLAYCGGVVTAFMGVSILRNRD